MNRKKLLKRTVFILCLVIISFIVGFYSYLALANDPGSFWRTVNSAHVTLNGPRFLKRKSIADRTE